MRGLRAARRAARPRFNLNLVFLILAAPGVILHEIAHAVTARAFGLRLRYVRLGSGRVLYAHRVAGVRVEWRLPSTLDGEGCVTMKTRALSRWQWSAVFLSGPVASAAWWGLLVYLSREWLPLCGVTVSLAVDALRGCRNDVQRTVAMFLEVE